VSSHLDLAAVPPAVITAFGSDRAQPRVRWFYTSQTGVQKPKPRPVLTTQLALQLRAQGASTIELAWRWRRVRMRVTSGPHSVWGEEGPPVPEASRAVAPVPTPPAQPIG
jgi:hypothetical protein